MTAVECFDALKKFLKVLLMHQPNKCRYRYLLMLRHTKLLSTFYKAAYHNNLQTAVLEKNVHHRKHTHTQKNMKQAWNTKFDPHLDSQTVK